MTKRDDPRALPQHGLLRQQRLRAAGRRRGVLRQGRRAAERDRGRVPRRADPQPVRLRPDPPARAFACPVPAGGRAPRRRPDDDAVPGRGRARRLRDPRADHDDPGARHQADVLHRCAARVPARAVEHPRRHRAGPRQPAVPRRAADPHHARPGASSRSPSRRAARCRRRTVGIDAAAITLDSKTGAIRAMVGGRAFGSGPNESQINMALVPRQTGSASRCSSSPRRSPPARSRTTSSTGGAAACCRTPATRRTRSRSRMASAARSVRSIRPRGCR